ncbi:MAG TPA: serine hydrolase domain-containing protein [Leptospiraceae bacterium]|nr:serine hydrolase domain-containing protein [Leptospiraceae bacterium]HRG74166.1 serine hydrolase domain-containing protein [Leptospiraceae bacterium]
MKLIYFWIGFFLIHCNITSVKEGEAKIVERFEKTFKNSKYSKAATLLVHSDSLKIHLKSSAGLLENQKSKVIPDQPFHTASIGKMFTSVLIYQLVESGKLSLNDSVHKILGSEILKNLFIYEGVDYSEKATISHLLSHTSGVDDYFDSVDKKNKSVIDEITTNPEKFWTPLDLVNFTRTNQKAIAPPGAKFHYSDTGYILLGLVIEKITNKKLEVVLQEKIFAPLAMKNTYMYLRSEPSDKTKLPVSTMMLGDKNVTGFKSISADWAGGGLISTTEDLLLFHQALLSGKLVTNKTYLSFMGKNKFMDGIYYGQGLMTVRFGDMSFLMPSTPDLHGHSGLLATLLFYSPDYDSHILVNLGSTEDVGDSFELMFWIMQDLKEIKNLTKGK